MPVRSSTTHIPNWPNCVAVDGAVRERAQAMAASVCTQAGWDALLAEGRPMARTIEREAVWVFSRA